MVQIGFWTCTCMHVLIIVLCMSLKFNRKTSQNYLSKKKSKGKARNTGRFTTVQESMVISSGCLTPDRDGCKLQARACVMQSERQTKT